MKAQIGASILAVTVAVTLVACASKGPASSADRAGAGAMSSEYRSLVDNASSEVICQRTAVTGSRIQGREVCRTRAQMEEDRERALQFIRNVERTATMSQPLPDRSPGVAPSPAPRAP